MTASQTFNAEYSRWHISVTVDALLLLGYLAARRQS
jgi:hypothetical protein